MLAVALALGSSACYGVSNFLGPLLARRHTLVSVLIISQLAALVACALYLAWDGGAALPRSGVLLAILAGAGNAGGLIAFYRAAQLGALAVAAPIGALGAILPVTWGLANGDPLRPTQAVGILLALAGSALAARRAEPSGATGLAHPDPRASALWAAASALAFGVFLTALPLAAEDGRGWAIFDARVALVVMLLLWAGRRLAEVRVTRDLPLLAVPGLLLVAGTVVYTFAYDKGQLSLVSVAGSLFPIFTVSLGVIVLGERLSGLQAAGVVAAMTGVTLIAL
jgi:drug/metabolite transporter (DMT)-like permease